MLKIRLFAIFLFMPGLLLTRERFVSSNETAAGKLEQPWFTGPLLASGSTTIPVGHINVQPYFFSTKIPAQYNQHWDVQSHPTYWTLTTQIPVWIGLTSWMDILIQPQWSWNHQSTGGGHWTLGDSVAQLEFQLFRDDFPATNWIPSIKFAIRETFPTGKYRNLNPKKQGTDIGGAGSWSTSFLIAFGRIVHLTGVHYLGVRLNGIYTLFAPVDVKGFNTYGGGYGVEGTVYPKGSVIADLAFEVSLTKNWALAVDLVGAWRGSNRFSAKHNKSPSSAPLTQTTVQNPVISSNGAAVEYSIAPAIEYNFSADLGIIAGAWISLAGKNSNEFYTGVVSVNYYK